jgi:hypothetical protein
MSMNRKELAVLRDAISTVLAWPDAVRDQVARWIAAPEAARPNGGDPHPPAVASTESIFETEDASPSSRQVKARRSKPPSAKAEQRLLAAMRESPGVSVIALARAAGGGRSATAERLRGLASRGMVTKDSAGHWRLVADLTGEAARPPEASPS